MLCVVRGFGVAECVAAVLSLGGGEVTARQQQFACNFIIPASPTPPLPALQTLSDMLIAGEGVVGDAGVEEMRVNVHS